MQTINTENNRNRNNRNQIAKNNIYLQFNIILMISFLLSAPIFAVNICPLDKSPTEITIEHTRYQVNVPIGIYDNMIDVTVILDAVNRETGERTRLANKEVILELTIGNKFVVKSGDIFILSNVNQPFPMNTSENGTIRFILYTQPPLLNESISPKKISYSITASYVPKPKEPFMGSSKTERYVPGVFPIISMSACLPLFIVFGLLIAAMFAVGRNPFGLFDFSRVAFRTPTIGRGRAVTRTKTTFLTAAAITAREALKQKSKQLLAKLGEKVLTAKEKVTGQTAGSKVKRAGYGILGKLLIWPATRRLTEIEKKALKEKGLLGKKGITDLKKAEKELGRKLVQLPEIFGGTRIQTSPAVGGWGMFLTRAFLSMLPRFGYRPWSVSYASAPRGELKTLLNKKEQEELRANTIRALNLSEEEAKKIIVTSEGYTKETKNFIENNLGIKPNSGAISSNGFRLSREHAVNLAVNNKINLPIYLKEFEIKNIKREINQEGSILNNLAKIYGIDINIIDYIEKGNAKALETAIAKLKNDPTAMAIAISIAGPAAMVYIHNFANSNEAKTRLGSNDVEILYNKILKLNIENKADKENLTRIVISTKLGEWGDKSPREFAEAYRIIFGTGYEKKPDSVYDLVTNGIKIQQEKINNEEKKLNDLKEKYKYPNIIEKREIEQQENVIKKLKDEMQIIEKGIREITNPIDTINVLNRINNSEQTRNVFHPSALYDEIVAEKTAWLTIASQEKFAVKETHEKTYDEYIKKINKEINKLENELEKQKIEPTKMTEIINEIETKVGKTKVEEKDLSTIKEIENKLNEYKSISKEIENHLNKIYSLLPQTLPKDEIFEITKNINAISTINKQTEKALENSISNYEKINMNNPVVGPKDKDLNIEQLKLKNENDQNIIREQIANQTIDAGVINMYAISTNLNVTIPKDIIKEIDTESNNVVDAFFGKRENIVTTEIKPISEVSSTTIKPNEQSKSGESKPQNNKKQ